MTRSHPHKPADPVPLDGVAADNLRYIRATMESATAFTGVSGKGYVLGGATALVTARIAAVQHSEDGWLLTWLLEAALAASVMLLLTAEKARVQGRSLLRGSGRKLMLAVLPTLAVGAIVTLALQLQHHTALLPGLWLVLYGAAVLTGGTHSIKPIAVMGLLFILLGSLQLLFPLPPDPMLALGFGGLHLGFGILIWRRYGG